MPKWVSTVKAVIVAAALLVSGEAAAATIYGMIQQGNQPVRNAQVVLTCGAEEAKTTTDDRGNYRITTPRTGSCKLQVGGASGEVTLYQDPTRYNFEMSGARLVRR
jgi:hypothetical protein